jgi:mRNA interferase MazF
MGRKKVDYVPDRGDIIRVTFDPVTGHEQAGRRPALVISPAAYNGLVGLALVCPITGTAKGYPYEVAVSADLEDKAYGVILSDHLRSVDWRTRRAEFICKATDEMLAEVCARLVTLIEPN